MNKRIAKKILADPGRYSAKKICRAFNRLPYAPLHQFLDCYDKEIIFYVSSKPPGGIYVYAKECAGTSRRDDEVDFTLKGMPS